jgi:hypothetical protein
MVTREYYLPSSLYSEACSGISIAMWSAFGLSSNDASHMKVLFILDSRRRAVPQMGTRKISDWTSLSPLVALDERKCRFFKM